ncbi:MAG: T9SS type A sorting domain-containing protein [Flavobacteriales bacterium]|nr:T9SS type A sorting domain-containing protein [Flavobacteriales bacterium]
MKKTFLATLLLHFCSITMLMAQQWTVYNTINSDIPNNTVLAIKIDQVGNKWVGSTSGISKFDNTEWTTNGTHIHPYTNDGIAFESNNHLWLAPSVSQTTLCDLNDTCYLYPLPSSSLGVYNGRVVAVDSSDNIWLGGGASELGKVLKYDGSTWTLYDDTEINIANCIAIDDSQHVWIGGGGRVCKFDGNTWTLYPVQNSVNDIAIDDNDTKWLATSSGLVKFDSVMTTFNTANSDIQSNLVKAVTIDLMGNKWLGTDYGLAKFNDTSWTFYTTSNSDLPSNNIISLATGLDGRIWVGTSGEGLAVFEDPSIVPEACSANFSLVPNPSQQHDWFAIDSSTGTGQLQYLWEWGDGATSNQPFPSHTYAAEGYYNICLTVSDANGCSDTYCDSSTYIYKTMTMVTVNVVGEMLSGINEHLHAETPTWYPNPTSDRIQIDFGIVSTEITINTYNIFGELVQNERRNVTGTVEYALPKASGVYLVKMVYPDGKVSNLKVVKE